MKRKIIYLFVVLAMLFSLIAIVGVSPAAATGASLNSTADATIAAGSPSTNYGTSTAINIQAYKTGQIQRGLITVNLSSILLQRLLSLV